MITKQAYGLLNRVCKSISEAKVKSVFAPVGVLAGAGMLISKACTRIQNDATRKNLLNDLHLNDPLLKEIPKDQLLEWYATIYHFAPKFSLDRGAVKETLEQFARFGRVDVNTLKMLADTEKATQQAAAAGKSWGDLFEGLSKAVAINATFGG